MAKIMEVIEYFDNTGNQLVHRVPEDGSGETKIGSQLVVRESQQAVFFRDGKAMDVFGAGRHTLTTMNLPILTGMLKGVFDGKSPFRVEVYFVNSKVFTDLKWGTSEPIPFRDSELQMIRLRSFGIYSTRVKDPQLFVNKMVGTQGLYTTEQIDGFLKNVIVSRLADYLGENYQTILDVAQHYDELGTGLKARLQEDFGKYGLEMVDLYISAITPPPEVQARMDERAGMAAVGDLNQYMKFKAANAMGDAAKQEGGAAGAGVGMGAGIGMGMMMPGMLQQAMASGPMAACPKCGTQNQTTAKFCSNCGGPMAVTPATTPCPKCGKPVASGSKFCNDCGAKLG
ncbi:MAG: virion core protein (lumpy skin disease virus) [Candidatus Edwardsbacteria bacterium RifOxyA12_full_54_48]|nr:MAG: virion core protein (lumpy skin disease virus) [Candidatus Edwardsbacteria bacterium RifOxyC12_full_54_24]OGF08283.1 MAG: virion core protein (lumpy skin disease virus) [Candidatus Edwardsbacteria bacterium RifOxyA12_full_54_48]OGF11580.1 MAG: virion core protein (lumpy skin disease virus) [Candidatus Edwardsbacteria bacterium GWE2_54_12]OGJ17174.1 MAG: virion core protein (lumpy skin disease virus) [Candidatus Edwardsbacteria bacterium RifOxyB12_full_52_30]HBZ86543.1 virion core protei